MQTINAQYFYDLFAGLGVPRSAIPFLIAQVALESNNFRDHKVLDHFNPSGITWINKPYQKGATKGNPLPQKETGGKLVYYARFDSLQSWARDYLRILSLGKNKPLQAQDIEDYANRLKANGYFKSDLEPYKKALKSYYSKFAKLAPASSIIVPVIIVAIVLYFVIK